MGEAEELEIGVGSAVKETGAVTEGEEEDVTEEDSEPLGEGVEVADGVGDAEPTEYCKAYVPMLP